MIKLNRENTEDILALTPMQEGMLFHYLKDPGSGLYFEQLCLEISGDVEIDVKFFEKAWNFVIESNAMLRAVFRWEKVDHPIQVILKERILQPEYYGFAGKNFCNKESIEEIKVKDRKEKFNLQEVPFRLTLCRLDRAEYVMIVSHHHILYDGWSNGIILEEFFHAYEALCSLKEPVKPVKTGYREFVRRLQTQTRDSGQGKDIQEKYWRQYLTDFGKDAGVSTGPVRKKSIKEVGHYQTGLGETRKKKIEIFIREHRITLAALLYSAWGIVLQKYNDTRDMIFSVTVSGRSAKIKGIEKVVGIFGSTLPLRVKTGADQSIMNLLGEINEHMLRVEEYENNSLEVVNECLEEAQKNEIFDSLVVVENYPVKLGIGQKKGPLTVRSFSNWGMTPYDLTILITPFTNGNIEIGVSFLRELLTEAMVMQLGRHFTAVVDEILDYPQKKIGEIEAIPEEEKNTFINDLSREQKSLQEEAAKIAAGDSKPSPPGNMIEEKLHGIW